MRKAKFRATEVFLMGMALGWGILLLLPYDTFGSSPSYQAMAGFATESYWGVGMLVISLLHYVSMYFDQRSLKQFALIMSSGIWLFVAATLALSGVLSTGIVCYLLIGCLAAWIAIKVGVQE